MTTLIIIILICLLLFGGIFDFIFNLVGVGLKIFLSLVLIFATIYLGIKLFIVMIPWMFIVTLIAFIFGIIWLIKSIVKK